MLNSRSWVGVGIKGGGMVAIIGAEGMMGFISNLGFPNYVDPITISGLRLGIGLGGGCGLVAIFVFNSSNPYLDFNDKSLEDWGVNVSMGEKWDGTIDIIKNYKLFDILRKSKWLLASTSGKNLSDIRNCMAYLYNLYDLTDTSGPKILTVDVPFAGAGEELSAYYVAGTIAVGTEEVIDPRQYDNPYEA